MYLVCTAKFMKLDDIVWENNMTFVGTLFSMLWIPIELCGPIFQLLTDIAHCRSVLQGTEVHQKYFIKFFTTHLFKMNPCEDLGNVYIV